MKKTIFLLIVIFSSALMAELSSVYALWVWTPETNKWTNPKHAVKDTPKEQLQHALKFYTSKKYKEAIREFNKLIDKYPRAREAPEAQYHIGRCWEDQEKLYEAFKAYQLVIDKYPFSELSAEIVQRQFDIGVKILENLDKRLKFMDALSGANYDVIDVFKAVIKNAPYSKLAPAAQYKIGLYLHEKGLYQEARDEFEKVINDYPDSEWTKNAKYQIALSDAKRSTNPAYDQKITKVAVEQFKDFVKENPDAELTPEARKQIRQLTEKEAENNFLIGQFYEKQKNYNAAKLYYKTIVDDYTNSKWASKALQKIRELNTKIQ